MIESPGSPKRLRAFWHRLCGDMRELEVSTLSARDEFRAGD